MPLPTFVLSTVAQTVFEPDYVQKVELSRPLARHAECEEIHRQIRSEHQGVLVFGDCSFNFLPAGTFNDRLYTCGWHGHEVDAHNRTFNSGTPSILARNPDAAHGIVLSINEHRAKILELAPDKQVSVYTGPYRKPVTDTPTGILNRAHDLLSAFHEQGIDDVIDELTIGTNLFRHYCSDLMTNEELAGELVSEAALMIMDGQLKVPADKRLEIIPREWEGYTIPRFRMHCRSILTGEPTRKNNEQNIAIFIE